MADVKCCVKSCGLVRPREEMRPHKSRGRLIGYRCRDRHGFNTDNVLTRKGSLVCYRCHARRPRSEMERVDATNQYRYKCKDKTQCAKNS